jgi:hypothetical protein
MRAFRRSRLLLVAVLATVIGAGLAAYALADAGSGSTVDQIKANPGPQAFVQAYNLSTSEGQAAFTLHDGQTVSVLDQGTTRCLLHGIGTQTTGRCFPQAEVSEGQAVTVYDECASGGKNLMEITGLAPAGTAGVRLISSDGSSQDTAVVDGAFKFEGTNPAQGAPYPTNVEWVASSGAAAGSAELPVKAGQFCLPTS